MVWESQKDVTMYNNPRSGQSPVEECEDEKLGATGTGRIVFKMLRTSVFNHRVLKPDIVTWNAINGEQLNILVLWKFLVFASYVVKYVKGV